MSSCFGSAINLAFKSHIFAQSCISNGNETIGQQKNIYLSNEVGWWKSSDLLFWIEIFSFFVNIGNTMNEVFQNTDKYILNWSGFYKDNEYSQNGYVM